jgi:hypothetical protein
MPSVSIISPINPGKCLTPQVLSATEQSFSYEIDGTGTAVTGNGFLALTCDVAWLYSDTFGSGRQMLIGPAAQLVIPFSDGTAIGARTITGAGVLYGMVLEAPGA